MTGDSTNLNANMTQSETMFTNRFENHTQRVDLIDTESAAVQGFFSWLDQAVITWPGGEQTAVNVTASYIPTMQGLALYLAYPNFDNGSILHDPSIGLVEEAAPQTTTYSIDSLYLIAGIGVVALIIIGVIVIRKK